MNANGAPGVSSGAGLFERLPIEEIVVVRDGKSEELRQSTSAALLEERSRIATWRSEGTSSRHRERLRRRISWAPRGRIGGRRSGSNHLDLGSGQATR